MRFVLPLEKQTRRAWLVRIGLFIYDHLGGRKILPATKVMKRAASNKLDPLETRYTKAFEYSDCWVDDARLCVLNAVDASNKGAEILTRHKCTGLIRHKEHWIAKLQNEAGETISYKSKALVNAAGPWVEEVLNLAHTGKNTKSVRLVKGSHIITRKLFDGEHAYFFQNKDQRIFFSIPYENNTSTLIGTTDVPFHGCGYRRNFG